MKQPIGVLWNLAGQTINRDINMNSLTPEVRKAVAAALSPGEQVLWCGRSVPKAAWGEGVVSSFQSRAGRMVALGLSVGFGLYVGWFFLLMLFGLLYWAFHDGIDGFVGIIAFLLVGWAALIVGYAAMGHISLPFLTMFIAGRRSYIVTSNSAIVSMQRKSEVRLKCFELAELREQPEVMRLTGEGVGDVVFDYVSAHVLGDGGGSNTDMFWDTGFPSCPEAEKVVTLMREAIVKRKQVYEHETMKEMQEDYQAYLRRRGRL